MRNRKIKLALAGLLALFVVPLAALAGWDYAHPCEIVRPCLRSETVTTVGGDGTVGYGAICVERGPEQVRDPERCED